ncbi:hypothetical protein MRB53_038304 [Persea americana]|nr:hypothetical protein MRB53_038304 [Persea americana]
MERLEKRYHRMQTFGQSSGHKEPKLGRYAGRLSTSASSASLHKLGQAHRGVMPDVVERPPTATDASGFLPSRLSEMDRYAGLELLNDGLEVKAATSYSKPDDAASIRTDRPIPRECGLYYYEVTIKGKCKDGLVGIGLAGPKTELNRLLAGPLIPGHTMATMLQLQSELQWQVLWTEVRYGDVIGCGINFRTGSIFFTKNGVQLPVGVKKLGEHLVLNFGHTPFVYDIDADMMVSSRYLCWPMLTKVDGEEVPFRSDQIGRSNGTSTAARQTRRGCPISGPDPPVSASRRIQRHCKGFLG